MSINQPPGHYRDEQGREYYWDGERRHYLPDTSFRDLLEVSNKVFLYMVGLGFALIIGIPLLALIGWGIYEVLKNPGVLVIPVAFLLFIAFMIYIFWKIDEDE